MDRYPGGRPYEGSYAGGPPPPTSYQGYSHDPPFYPAAPAPGGPADYPAYGGPAPPGGPMYGGGGYPGPGMSPPQPEPPRGFAPPPTNQPPYGPGPGPYDGPSYLSGPPPPVGPYGSDRPPPDFDRGGRDGPPFGGPPGGPREGRYGSRDRDYPGYGPPSRGGGQHSFRGGYGGSPEGDRGGRFDDRDRHGGPPDRWHDRSDRGGRGGFSDRGGGFRGRGRGGFRGGRGGGFGGASYGQEREWGGGPPKDAPVHEMSKSEHEQLTRERLNRERPCRTLFVRNISFDTAPGQIRSLFEQHGEIKTFFDLSQKRGLVFITYYDIRAAEQAKRMLHGTLISDRPLDIHFSLPREEEQSQHCDRDKNQGTLFIILKHAKEPLNDDALRDYLSNWGEIKHIRPFKDNPYARFVEFFDSRATLAAYDQLPNSEYQGSVWDVKYAWDFVERMPPRRDFRPPYADRGDRERSPSRGGYGGGGRYEERAPFHAGGPSGGPPLGNPGRDDYGRPLGGAPGHSRDYSAPSGPGPAAPAAGAFSGPPAGEDPAAAERLQQAQKVQAILAALGRAGGGTTGGTTPKPEPTASAPTSASAPAASSTTPTLPPGKTGSNASTGLPASVLALLQTSGSADQKSAPAEVKASAGNGTGPPASILAMLGQNGSGSS
ncbi:hypothetical protein OC845_000651 [Tilletia horrida]|nr:hypothetical protein OC845_000651 [Tilletia horrida]